MPTDCTSQESYKLATYSDTISGMALQAVNAAEPVVGTDVRAKKRLIFEAADNAGIIALLYAGSAGCIINPAVCVPIMRATN